jgi:type VI secretion system protein ImpA
MIDLEKLLQPSAGDDPCGIDVSYDPKFLELDALVAGKPETQFSAANEPDWKAVRDTCLELFAQSKHLRLAVPLTVALVKLEGPSGLRDGLRLLEELLVRYWDGLYPKLDPDEDNDPLERINIIASLSTPLGTFGDPLRFLERVREMPLSNSLQLGRFGLAAIAGDTVRLPDGSSQPPPSAAEVAAAFRDTKPEELEQSVAAVGDALGAAQRIESFLADKVGADKAPDMNELSAVLKDIRKALSPYTAMDADTELATGTQTGGTVSAGSDRRIRSRQDVVKALDEICAFYARAEPSSPLPFLLRRAKRLAEMDFVEAIKELSPEALGPLHSVLGTPPETPPE